MVKKVKIKNKKFIVIPEAKLVRGEMPVKRVDADLRKGIKPIHRHIINEATWACDFSRELTAWPIDDNEDLVYANAYCDENDKWDEKTGIEVCAAKLEMKNHLKLARLYDRVHRNLIEAANIVAEWCMAHTNKAKAIEDDLIKTYGRMPL